MRRVFNVSVGANEALIKEYQILFGKICDFKGSKYLVVEKLMYFRQSLHEYLNKPLKLLKDKWDDRFDEIEKEISEYFRVTFKSEYLFIEFSKNIPDKVAASTELEFNRTINAQNINFFQFLGTILDIRGLSSLVNAQLNFLDKVIECLKEGGLLEIEINKRDELSFLRYHVQFTLRNEGKRRWKARELFLTKKGVEDIFNNLKNNRLAIVDGKVIRFEIFDGVKITKSLLQEHEANLYRKKYIIRNDEEFVKRFQDATKEFYNNTLFENNPPIIPLPFSSADNFNNQNLNKNLKDRIRPAELSFKINEIRNYIKNNKIRDAINKLESLAKEVGDKSLHNDILLASAQYNREEKNITFDLDNSKIGQNKAINALIKLVDEIEIHAKNKID